jgi:hypothetical protein
MAKRPWDLVVLKQNGEGRGVWASMVLIVADEEHGWGARCW